MRICIHKATNKIIEMQSNATAGSLIQNAINSGYVLGDIEEREVDDVGYAAAKALDPTEIAAQAEQAAKAAKVAAKLQSIVDNLPSRAAVIVAIDGADTIPKLRTIVKKMANVLYWIAKDQEG